MGKLTFANAQTVSDGKLLESGGAYYINLSCGKERLRIKKNKSIKIEFPKISDKDMSLFDGKVDSLGNIIIYDPEYNSATNPVYYQSPNIIVPNPANNNVQPSTAIYSPPPPSNSSSSPAYQS